MPKGIGKFITSFVRSRRGSKSKTGHAENSPQFEGPNPEKENAMIRKMLDKKWEIEPPEEVKNEARKIIDLRIKYNEARIDGNKGKEHLRMEDMNSKINDAMELIKGDHEKQNKLLRVLRDFGINAIWTKEGRRKWKIIW